MRVLSYSKRELVLSPSRKDGVHSRSWYFDLDIIPFNIRPKQLVIQRKVNRYLQRWTMSWDKFLRQTAVGNIALIDKSEFKFTSKPQ